MRRLLGLTLSFAVFLPGVVALSAAPARAQEAASAGGLDALRGQYEQLLAVERNAATPPEVRELNRAFLEERRARLAAALRERIGTLDKYRAAVAATLDDAEKRFIDDSVARLSAELRALLPEAVPPAAPAPRRTRRPALAVEASLEASARLAAESTPAESARAEPAASVSAAGGAAPIEIVSPARDRVVHTAEVELEVGIHDEEIDDLMVAVYTPASEKPKTARVLNVRRSDRGSKSVVVALSKGDNRVEVSDLKRGGIKAERNITYAPPETPALGAAAAAFVKPARPAAAPVQDGGGEETMSEKTAPTEYDWGRVRSYFTAGMVFSKENDEFSKSDLALSFVLDKNYLKRRSWNINTFFEARLTSVPVATREPAEGEEAGEEEEEEADSFDTFVKSKKAGFAQAGVYVPVNVSYWRNQRELNTLFIAPLVKFGILTISGEGQTAEAETFGDDDVFNFRSFGFRLGHFRYPRLKNPCPDIGEGRDARGVRRANETEKEYLRRTSPFADRDCETEADYAPELVSWLDISRGKYENFAVSVPTGQLDADGNPVTRLENRWRWQAEGRLKIPETPFIVGFDGNFGDGPDDLRFGFGMRFELGKLIHRLKLQQFLEAQEEQKERAKTPPAEDGTDSP